MPLAALRLLLAPAFAALLLASGLARAADDELYAWCVTSYIDKVPERPPGKFETIVNIEKVVSCSYFRGAPADPGPAGEDPVPRGIGVDDVKALSCSELGNYGDDLRAKRRELDDALASALIAEGVAVNATNRARSIESQFHAGWSASYQSCARARQTFRDGVDGTERAKCDFLRGTERLDCLDNLLLALMEGRNGAAMDLACHREASDRTLWNGAAATVASLEATERDIRNDIRTIQHQQNRINILVGEARGAQKTCKP